MTAAEILVASVPTPFGSDGRLDPDAVRMLLADLEPCADAVLVGGTAGQFPALSDDERLLLFDLALDALGPDRVLGHIGAPSLTQVRHLAEAATGIGLRRFVCLTPYFLPVDGAAVLEWYRDVARAVEDGELLVALNPERTGVAVSPAAAALLTAVDGVSGLTVGGTAAARTSAYAAALQPGQRLWSTEETALPRVLAEGGHGVVSAAASAFPALFARLRGAVRDGSDATGLQDLVREAVAAVSALPGLHLALSLRSGHPWRSRMPGPTLPPGSRDAVAGLLRRVDDATGSDRTA